MNYEEMDDRELRAEAQRRGIAPERMEREEIELVLRYDDLRIPSEI